MLDRTTTAAGEGRAGVAASSHRFRSLQIPHIPNDRRRAQQNQAARYSLRPRQQGSLAEGGQTLFGRLAVATQALSQILVATTVQGPFTALSAEGGIRPGIYAGCVEFARSFH